MMDDPEYTAISKKLEQLRKDIPIIEEIILHTQGKPNYKIKHDKLILMKKLLTDGRPKLKTLLQIEATIAKLRKDNRQNILANEVNTNKVKLERPDILTIKTEHNAAIQSPESPPMSNDVKQIEPITIPIERKEGRGYLYERDFSKSDRSNCSSHIDRPSTSTSSSYRDHKYERDDRYRRSRERRSRSRDRCSRSRDRRSRSRDRRSRSRDRRSRSRDRSYERDRRSRSIERDRRRSRSRERKDYRSQHKLYRDEDATKKHYKTDPDARHKDRYYYDWNEYNRSNNNDRSTNNQGRNLVNRSSVFNRVGPKVQEGKSFKKELHTYLKASELHETIENDLAELELENENRFGITADNKKRKEDNDELQKITERKRKIEQDLIKQSQDDLAKQLQMERMAKDLLLAPQPTDDGINTVDKQISSEINQREPSSSTPQRIERQNSNSNSTPSSQTNPDSSERLAFKYNRKVRPRDGSSSSDGHDSGSPLHPAHSSSTNANSARISSSIGIIQNDPRLKSRDPRPNILSPIEQKVFNPMNTPPPNLPPASTHLPPHLSNPFNKYNAMSMQIPCNPMPDMGTINPNNLRHVNITGNQYNQPPYVNPILQQRNMQNMPPPSNSFRDARNTYLPPERRNDFINPPNQYHRSDSMEKSRKLTYKEHRLAKEREKAKNQMTPVESTVTSESSKATTTTDNQMQSETSSTESVNSSPKEGSNEAESTTSKKPLFDNAFRTHNWDILDGTSKEQRPFRIPKLGKKGDSQALNQEEAEIPMATTKIRVSHFATSKSETATLSKVEKATRKQNEADSEPRESRNTRKRRQSNAESISPDEDISNDTPEPDSVSNTVVETKPGVTEQIDAPSSTSAETPRELTTIEDSKELVREMFNTMMKPSVENFVDNLSFWADLDLDQEKLDRIKAILCENKDENESEKSNEVSESSDSLVSSSTASSTAGVAESSTAGSSNTGAKETVKRMYKKKSNELSRLNEDIRTMFISDGVLTATGRRACTLYKNQKQNQNQSPSPPKPKAKPGRPRVQPAKEKEIMAQPEVPQPKKIRGRRNTTIERESTGESSTAAQPKRIARRRGTICEVIQQPSTSNDGMQPPIKMKFKTVNPPANSGKRGRSFSIESTSDDLETRMRKKSEGEESKKKKKVSFGETTENEYDKDSAIDTTTKKVTQNKVKKLEASQMPSCKVVLEKVDSLPQRVTRAQKRSTEQTAAEESDASDDSSLLVPQNPKPKKKCDKSASKNIDPEMYLTNTKFTTRCLYCTFCHRNGIIGHHVNNHSDIELHISRPSPKMAKKLLDQRPKAKQIGRKYQAFCYLCESEQTLSKKQWIRHVAKHTGEYERYCKQCNFKSNDVFKKSPTCDHMDIGVWNNFEMDRSLDVFMCNICNYIQLKEKSLKNHVRNEHEIHSIIDSNYKKVALFEGFPDSQKGEEKDTDDGTSTSEREEPVNADVFKSSKQHDGLFDDDTMKFMKEVTFNDSEAPRSNSFSMINRLSERFKKQNDSTESQSQSQDKVIPKEEPVEITYKSVHTDAEARRNSQETAQSENKANKRAVSSTSTQANNEPSDENSRNSHNEADDNDWESCSNDSTEDIPTENESVTSSKNSHMASTLNRLISQFGKPKSRAMKNDKTSSESLTSVEGVKVESIEPEIGDLMPQRVQNIGFTDTLGLIEYCCLIGNCDFKSEDDKKFLAHLPQHRQGWEGFCYICDKQLHNHSISLKKELNHLKEFHIDKYINEMQKQFKDTSLKSTLVPISAELPIPQMNIDTDLTATAATTPLIPACSLPAVSTPTTAPGIVLSAAPTRPLLIKVRRLSGDTLSTPSLQQGNCSQPGPSSSFYPMQSNGLPHSSAHQLTTTQSELSAHDWLKQRLSTTIPNPSINLQNVQAPTTIISMLSSPTINFAQNLSLAAPSLPTLNENRTPNEVQSIETSSHSCDFNMLKPWTKCFNLKSPLDSMKMLQKKSLLDLYKCMGQNCTFTTSDSREMLTHLRNHEELAGQQIALGQSNSDSSSWLECSYCEELADSCSILVKHIIAEHLDSIYQCSLCLYRTVAECNVREHCKVYHNKVINSYITCNGTQKDMSKESTDILTSRMTNVKAIQCGYGGCNLTFYVLSEFMYHINYESSHTQNTLIECFVCKKNIERVQAVKHLLQHNIGLFQCVYCLYGVANVADIRIHLADCHSTKLPLAAMRNKRDGVQAANNNIDSTGLCDMNEDNSDDSPTVSNGTATGPFQKTKAVFRMPTGVGSDPTKIIQEVIMRYNEAARKFVQNVNNKPNSPPAVILSPPQIAIPSTSKQTITMENPPSASTSTLRPLQPKNSVSRQNSDPTGDTTKIIQDTIDQSALSLLGGTGLAGHELYRCGFEKCAFSGIDANVFNVHLLQHKTYRCFHCGQVFDTPVNLRSHIKRHGIHRFLCNCCDFTGALADIVAKHLQEVHKQAQIDIQPLNPGKGDMNKDIFIVSPQQAILKDFKLHLINRNKEKILSTKKSYLPEEVDMLPHQSIFTEKVSCQLCSYSTVVRSNIYRHLLKRDCVVNKATSGMDPVNPVPCLDTGEKYFDKMINMAASSNPDGMSSRDRLDQSIQFVPEDRRFVCGAKSCHYQNHNEDMLMQHINALHINDRLYNCPHCNKELADGKTVNANNVVAHLRCHDSKIFKCPSCQLFHFNRADVEKHLAEMHPKCKDKILEFNRQSKQNDNVKQAKSFGVIFKYKCNICFESKFDTRPQIKRHLQEVHRLNYQYQCTQCSFQNDTKGVIKEHIMVTHGNQDACKIKVIFERIEDSVDNTPIWKRNDPNRVKQIRGILVEDEEEISTEDTPDETDGIASGPQASTSKVNKGKKATALIKRKSKPTKSPKKGESPAKFSASATVSQSNQNHSDDDVEWIQPPQVETICIDEDTETEKGTKQNVDKDALPILKTGGIKTEKNAELMTEKTGETVNLNGNAKRRRDSLPAQNRQSIQPKAASSECLICHKRIPVTESLKLHYETEHPATVLNRSRSVYVYICYHCEFRDEDFEKVLEHWTEQHKNCKLPMHGKPTNRLNLMTGRPFWFKISKMVKCFHCTSKLDFNEIRSHCERNHALELPITTGVQNNLLCGHCDEAFTDAAELKNHYTENHHPFYRMQLDSEPLDFLTTELLSNLRKHGCLRKVKCLWCKEIFDDRSDFNKHHSSQHVMQSIRFAYVNQRSVRFGCSVCRESFTDVNDALKHIRGHSLQYMCNFCDKKVSYSKLIKSHHEIMHNSSDTTYRNVSVRENLENYLKMTITFANGLTLTKADVMNTTYGNIETLINYIELLDHEELKTGRMNQVNGTN